MFHSFGLSSKDSNKNNNLPISHPSTLKRPPNLDVDLPVENPLAPPGAGLLKGFALYKSPLKSPPSLGQMVSPRATMFRSSSLLSVGSLLNSPISKNSRSRRGSSALFTKEDYSKGLLFRSFPYEDLENGFKDNKSEPYLNEFDNLPEIMKIPKEFFFIIQLLWQRHKIFASWRLGADPYKELSRRCSMEINGEIVYSPKEPNTSSRTESADKVCGGHIAELEPFGDKKYRLKDNNHPGAFHKSIIDQKCNQELLSELQQNMSDDILDVRIFANSLICFAKKVENYDKELQPIGKKAKHFIQEARTLFYVLDIIEKKLGKFISATSEEIRFVDPQGNICKLDLTKLIPNPHKVLPKLSTREFIEFNIYVTENELEDYHAPVFNILQKDEEEISVPVMVLAGRNGLHIAGDVDPENIAERSDAPPIIYKSFNGANDDKRKFIIGLQILAARLSYSNAYCFNIFMKDLKSKLLAIDNGESIINAYKEFFEPDHEAYSDYEIFYNYNKDEYYKDTYLPIVLRTLELYQEHPELLNIVGESSIGGLVTQNDCDHELYMHDADNLNPTDELAPMGTTFFYYQTEECPNGRLCVAGDEKSYVTFLLHNQKILQKNRIAVHPCRLGNKKMIDEMEAGALFAEEWLDVIKIQALYEAHKGAYKFKQYRDIVLADMKKRRSKSEEVALEKLNTMFDTLYPYLGNFSRIESELFRIYNKYSAASAYIKNKLGIKSDSATSHKCHFDFSI